MSIPSSRHRLTEQGMKLAERCGPRLAVKSGQTAYWMALRETGAVTVKASAGKLVERRRDGSVTVIKDLPVGRRVKVGTVLKRVKRQG